MFWFLSVLKFIKTHWSAQAKAFFSAGWDGVLPPCLRPAHHHHSSDVSLWNLLFYPPFPSFSASSPCSLKVSFLLDDATSLPVLDAERPAAALRTQTNPLIPAQKTRFPQLLKSRYPTPARKIRSIVEPSEAFLHIWGEKLLTAKIFSAASRPHPPGSPGTTALRSQHGNCGGTSKQSGEN